MSRQIWSCKIGEAPPDDVPEGGDGPMREAVSRAYRELTGNIPKFLFSGWGAELTEIERALVENREPRQAWAAMARAGYQAYAANTGGKTFDGREMPKWEELPQRTIDAWIAAVKGIWAAFRWER